jgi:hypothetical protein
MKGKILDFILIWLIISLISSCITWYLDYKTKIISMRIYNGEATQNSVYRIKNNHLIDKEACYCILIDFEYSDTLINQEKNRYTSLLKKISLIDFMYGAYDPGYVHTFITQDSVVSINIESLYNFNDSTKAGQTLNDYFDLFYAVHSWYDLDTIKKISNINLDFPISINRRMRDVFAHYDLKTDFIFRLNRLPEYKRQQFILTVKLMTNRSFCDTTEIVNFN